ncbi:MAG: hypothetical protein GC134_03455 [Proteobacteria bacterium]|nr:hypothetical protein [Pseudomonadota bacterium]
MPKSYPKRLLVYVVASDNGLAPNINGGLCSLSVCKPVVRQSATIGTDWVVGMSTAKHGAARVIYAMTVDEKIPFADFFTDPRFQAKKPSRSNPKGDNFFDLRAGTLQVVNTRAAHAGKADKIARDLRTPLAVIGHTFWYFGANAPEVPGKLQQSRIVQGNRRGHRIITDAKTIKAFCDWLYAQEQGVRGPHRDPVC